MSTETTKVSGRLPTRLVSAIISSATARGTNLWPYIEGILMADMVAAGLIEPEESERHAIMWDLVRRATIKAREIGFRTDLTPVTLEACMNDAKWAADYEKFVGDNPYKHGNPEKQRINQELGAAIAKEAGARGDMTNGKAKTIKVAGHIIQGYTALRQI